MILHCSNKYMKNSMIYLLILITFIDYFNTLEEPGRTNPKYTIKDYYGSRHLSSFLASTFIMDDPAVIKWSQGLFISESNTKMLFIADSNDQTIKIIMDNIVNLLVGKSQYASFRNGDALNAYFNKPNGVIFYNETSFPNNNKEIIKPFLFKYRSIQCLYANQYNYTLCAGPPILNVSEYIDREMVKLIDFNAVVDKTQPYLNYLFISDTDNHCIRKVDLLTAEVTTYAGKCEVSGFKDGPTDINRFNKPKGIGIDNYGHVYVYDSGNRYMRMIDENGFVATLINGACYEYKMGYEIPNSFNYHSEDIICFRKWIKTTGEPKEHIYVKPLEEICYENIINCPNFHTNLLYNKK